MSNMFEGKHIHYSPVDQKPLCSFSAKLCRQRRLNGYAFCIRHIMEDTSAPFRLCSFIPPPGQNKCTNVISNTHPRGLCNTHLQLAGFPAAKRERRHLAKKEKSQSMLTAVIPNSCQPGGQIEPTSSSVETSDGDPYTFSDDAVEVKQECNDYEEVYGKPSGTNSPTGSSGSPLAIQPLTPSSTSSSGDSNAEIAGSAIRKISKPGFTPTGPLQQQQQQLQKAKTVVPAKPDNKCRTPPQRKKRPPLYAKLGWKSSTNPPLPAALQQLDDGLHCRNSPAYLLPNLLDSDEDDEESYLDLLLSTSNKLQHHKLEPLHKSCSVRPHASVTTPALSRCQKLERSKLDVRRRYLQLARMMDADRKCQRRLSRTHFAKKLLLAARRWPEETALLLLGRKPFGTASSQGVVAGSSLNPSNWKIFSKRRCSFRRPNAKDAHCIKEDDAASICAEYSLPCSTLCNRHILYSVDQQLFEFCSARGGPSGSTPCGAPVLAIHSGLPYCTAHSAMVQHQQEVCGSMNANYNSSSGHGIANQAPLMVTTMTDPNRVNRRKCRSRSTSLGRHASRRMRGTGVVVGMDVGIGGNNSGRRVKRISSANDSGETRIMHCADTADNGIELDVETIDSPENCSPAYPTPAQLILPPHVACSSGESSASPCSSESVAISGEQEVEMLEDHDFKELLNRLPDEAFQEIFAMTQVASSSRGLFVPSQEEAEELERALAEDVPIPILSDKYPAVANESDLGDLSLIDDHTLALAHDLVMGATGSVAQNLLLTTAETQNSSSHLFLESGVLDKISLQHQPMINPGYAVDGSSSLFRRRNLQAGQSGAGGSQFSPARGSSPSLNNCGSVTGNVAHPL